jgi:hypothetical protein
VEGDLERHLQHEKTPYLRRFWPFLLTPGRLESLQRDAAGGTTDAGRRRDVERAIERAIGQWVDCANT